MGLDDIGEMEIGSVELIVQCNDNDDPGPGFTDSVDGISDLMDVEGHSSGDIEDQSADGTCAGEMVGSQSDGMLPPITQGRVSLSHHHRKQYLRRGMMAVLVLGHGQLRLRRKLTRLLWWDR